MQVEQQLRLFVNRIESLEAENAALRMQLSHYMNGGMSARSAAPSPQPSPPPGLAAASAAPAAGSSLEGEPTVKSDPYAPSNLPPPAATSSAHSGSNSGGMPSHSALHAVVRQASAAGSELLLLAASPSPSQIAQEQAFSDLMDAGEGAAPAQAVPMPAAASARKKRAASPTPLQRDGADEQRQQLPQASSAHPHFTPTSKRARTHELSSSAEKQLMMQMETQLISPLKPPASPPRKAAAAAVLEPAAEHGGGAEQCAAAASSSSRPLLTKGPVHRAGASPPPVDKADGGRPPSPSPHYGAAGEGLPADGYGGSDGAAHPAALAAAAEPAEDTNMLEPQQPQQPQLKSVSRKAPSPVPPTVVVDAATAAALVSSSSAAAAKPSALALVSAAFPSEKDALAAAAVAAATPSLPAAALPNSQAVVTAALTPELRAEAEANISAGVAAASRSDWSGALRQMSLAIDAYATLGGGGGGWQLVPLSWLKQRSTVCAKLGLSKDAYADAHRMTALHGNHWAGFYTLSTLLGRDKLYAEALRQCRRAWRRVPKRNAVRAQIAALQQQQGDAPPASPGAAERLERESDSDRRKVSERLAQLEAKLHVSPPSVLNEEEDVPGQFDEDERESAVEEAKKDATAAAPAAAAAGKSEDVAAAAASSKTAAAAPRSPDKLAAALSGAAAAAGKPPSSPSKPGAPASSLITFGTYKLSGSAALDVVTSALRAGFRRLDTGASYNNEEQIGRALVASGIPRAQVHVTTKLAWADLTTTEGAYSAALASLRKLGVSYVDCLLLHHPGRAKLPPNSVHHAPARIACWRALERLQSEGRARRIGVSNFEIKHLAPLLAQAKVRPAVNQVEMHPLLYDTQRALAEYCREQGVTLEAYSPLGGGRKELMAHPLLLSLCRSLTPAPRSPAEVLLRWSLQHGFVPVVKATQHAHQRAALAVAQQHPPPSFTLNDEHMRTLDDMGKGKDAKRFAWDPTAYA